MTVRFEEIRNTEKYRYLRSLGYTEKQALVLCLIDLSDESRMRRILKAYGSQKEKDFTDFIIDNPDPKPIPRHSLRGRLFDDEEEEDEKEASPVPGFFRKASPLFEADDEDDDLSAYASGGYNGSAGRSHSQRLACASPAGMSFRMSSFSTAEEDEEDNIIPGFFRRLSAEEEDTDTGLMEQIRTDSYETIEEKEKRDTAVSPTATFRPTFNTAAAGILLSNIRRGSHINKSMVRTEELLNYLSYDLKKPEGNKFEITKEIKKDGDHTYLFLGVQSQKVIPARQNICLLLDVSGSMYSNADQIILVSATLLAKMNPGDVFSLVTYADRDHVIIDGLKLNDDKNFNEIAQMLAGIEIDGCTYGSAGIEKAYEIVEANQISDGVNRVIIMTDGDLNFGIHDKDGLKGLIEKKRESGAYFSAIGTGIWNLQDDKLEALAKNGNGNYFVVNDIPDIRKSIRDNYESLVYPIAKNVKAQMEFNPAKVRSWKLAGYENRMLNHEDFRNDKVIAEPFGSGSYFTALFELTMNESLETGSDLKYQRTQLIPSDELGTLTIRYEDVNDSVVKELEFAVEEPLPATKNIEKAITCVQLADRLRSARVDELTRKKVQRLLDFESAE